MSADEFWKDDPQLFVSYRTSFINKKKREAEEEDYKSWLNGLYIYDGNSKLFSSLKQFIYNSLSNKTDNTKIDNYPNKPYSELSKENKVKKEEEDKKYKFNKFQSDLVYFGTLKQRYLKNLKKEGENKDG